MFTDTYFYDRIEGNDESDDSETEENQSKGSKKKKRKKSAQRPDFSSVNYLPSRIQASSNAKVARRETVKPLQKDHSETVRKEVRKEKTQNLKLSTTPTPSISAQDGPSGEFGEDDDPWEENVHENEGTGHSSTEDFKKSEEDARVQAADNLMALSTFPTKDTNAATSSKDRLLAFLRDANLDHREALKMLEELGYGNVPASMSASRSSSSSSHTAHVSALKPVPCFFSQDLSAEYVHSIVSKCAPYLTKELRFTDGLLFQAEETYITKGSPPSNIPRTVWCDARVENFILDLLSTDCRASSAPLKSLLHKYQLNEYSNVLPLLAGIVDALPAEIAMTVDYSLHPGSYEAYLKKEVYRLIFVTANDSEYPFNVPLLKASFHSEVTCPRILCRHVHLPEMNSKILLFRFVCELLLRAPHYSFVRSLYFMNVEHTRAIPQWLSDHALSKVTLGMGGPMFRQLISYAETCAESTPQISLSASCPFWMQRIDGAYEYVKEICISFAEHTFVGTQFLHLIGRETKQKLMECLLLSSSWSQELSPVWSNDLKHILATTRFEVQDVLGEIKHLSPPDICLMIECNDSGYAYPRNKNKNYFLIATLYPMFQRNYLDELNSAVLHTYPLTEEQVKNCWFGRCVRPRGLDMFVKIYAMFNLPENCSSILLLPIDKIDGARRSIISDAVAENRAQRRNVLSDIETDLYGAFVVLSYKSRLIQTSFIRYLTQT